MRQITPCPICVAAFPGLHGSGLMGLLVVVIDGPSGGSSYDLERLQVTLHARLQQQLSSPYTPNRCVAQNLISCNCSPGDSERVELNSKAEFAILSWARAPPPPHKRHEPEIVAKAKADEAVEYTSGIVMKIFRKEKFQIFILFMCVDLCLLSGPNSQTLFVSVVEIVRNVFSSFHR